LPLLLKSLPSMLERGSDPLSWLQRSGRDLKLIRPSSRKVIVGADIPADSLVLPLADLVWTRPAKVVVSKPRTARQKALASNIPAPYMIYLVLIGLPLSCSARPYHAPRPCHAPRSCRAPQPSHIS
jgi:hypothetical protein